MMVTTPGHAPPCVVCDYRGEMRPYFPTQELVQCPHCGLVFYRHFQAPTEQLYSEDYFRGAEYRDYVADKGVLQRNFRKRLPTLLRHAPGGTLFEIGAAYGFFLEVAQAHWQVSGVDIAVDAVRYARDTLKLDVTAGDFLDLPDRPAAFDVITMWDTIEHLQHPNRFVEKAARWLKPGGILVVSTGDVDSRLARWQGERWRLIHPPTHLFYFSPATLGRLMANYGLRVLQTPHVGYYRSLNAMLYGLLTLGERRYDGLYRLLTVNGRLSLPLYLNLFDIMMMIAQKPVQP